MFSVTVRSHMMIAHSLPKPVFGPAQNLHGATYVVDAEFKRQTLDENHIVIDIGKASQILAEVMEELNYKNLDESDRFRGKITTTEYIAFFVHQEVKRKIESWFEGLLKITLKESHIAFASYEAEV